MQYSDNGGQGGHSKPKSPKKAPAPQPAPTRKTTPHTTAAPEPLGPPVYIDDNYGSTNYDDYEIETDYVQYDTDYAEKQSDYVEEQSDYSEEPAEYDQEPSADYDENLQNQGEANCGSQGFWTAKRSQKIPLKLKKLCTYTKYVTKW